MTSLLGIHVEMDLIIHLNVGLARVYLSSLGFMAHNASVFFLQFALSLATCLVSIHNFHPSSCFSCLSCLVVLGNTLLFCWGVLLFLNNSKCKHVSYIVAIKYQVFVVIIKFLHERCTYLKYKYTCTQSFSVLGDIFLTAHFFGYLRLAPCRFFINHAIS